MQSLTVCSFPLPLLSLMNLIEKHLQDDVLILSLVAKRLDALNSGDALQAILPELKEKAPRVVLDLEQIGYMSSAGLRTIMQTAKHVSAAGGRLALCSVRPAVREIISIAGFETMLPLLPTRTEALGQW